MQWHGDIITLSGAAFFTDLSACWYCVEWSGRSAGDTAKARRKAAFIPKPDALSQQELKAVSETYGDSVAAFAE
ncbi:hypothetical protein K439DRAFT_1632917 [Ramaria rubella]|nr:hypothetical protein K439DRAFT_1632917 [Ramaria rubella]